MPLRPFDVEQGVARRIGPERRVCDGQTRLEFLKDMGHFIESMPKAELHVHVE